MVAALGGGGEPLAPAVADRCRALGELLARCGCHLLTGGGKGVMGAVARAFVAVPERRGLSLGILPGDAGTGEPPPGYPNPSVELAIRTHLPARGERGAEPGSRNHLNVLSADALIALAGSTGTLSEIRLALRYGKPIVAFVEDTAVELPGLPQQVTVLSDLDDVEAWLKRSLAVE